MSGVNNENTPLMCARLGCKRVAMTQRRRLDCSDARVLEKRSSWQSCGLKSLRTSNTSVKASIKYIRVLVHDFFEELFPSGAVRSCYISLEFKELC